MPFVSHIFSAQNDLAFNSSGYQENVVLISDLSTFLKERKITFKIEADVEANGNSRGVNAIFCDDVSFTVYLPDNTTGTPLLMSVYTTVERKGEKVQRATNKQRNRQTNREGERE